MKAVDPFVLKPKRQLRYADFILRYGHGLIFPSYGMQNAIKGAMR